MANKVGIGKIQKIHKGRTDIWADLTWNDLVSDVSIKPMNVNGVDKETIKLNFGNSDVGNYFVDTENLTKDVLVMILKVYEKTYPMDRQLPYVNTGKQFTYLNEWTHGELVEQVNRLIKDVKINTKRAENAFESFKSSMENRGFVIDRDFDSLTEGDLNTISKLWKIAEDAGVFAKNSKYDYYEVRDEIYKLSLNLNEKGEYRKGNRLNRKGIFKAFEEFLQNPNNKAFDIPDITTIDESTISKNVGNAQISDEEFDRLMGKY